MLIDVFRNFCFLFNKDIDECTDATSGCQQICTNSPGSFSCSCVVGHTLKSDNKTCEAPGNLTLKYVTSSQFCWFKLLKSCCFNICEVTKKSQFSLTLKKNPKKNAKKSKRQKRIKKNISLTVENKVSTDGIGFKSGFSFSDRHLCSGWFELWIHLW